MTLTICTGEYLTLPSLQVSSRTEPLFRIIHEQTFVPALPLTKIFPHITPSLFRFMHFFEKQALHAEKYLYSLQSPYQNKSYSFTLDLWSFVNHAQGFARHGCDYQRVSPSRCLWPLCIRHSWQRYVFGSHQLVELNAYI